MIIDQKLAKMFEKSFYCKKHNTISLTSKYCSVCKEKKITVTKMKTKQQCLEKLKQLERKPRKYESEGEWDERVGLIHGIKWVLGLPDDEFYERGG